MRFEVFMAYKDYSLLGCDAWRSSSSEILVSLCHITKCQFLDNSGHLATRPEMEEERKTVQKDIIWYMCV
jgi:hypothetical protein